MYRYNRQLYVIIFAHESGAVWQGENLISDKDLEGVTACVVPVGILLGLLR